MPDDLKNSGTAISVADENRRHVIFPWTKQAGLKPKEIVRAEGVHVWDGSGKRYLDLAAQLACVNAGHQHPPADGASPRRPRLPPQRHAAPPP